MGSLAGKRRDTFGLALNELRVRVRDGRAAPGTPLMVSDLAEELKLSPTPVREALAWLAGEGLIESQRGGEGGYRVRRLSLRAVEDLYALQDLLLAATVLPDPGPIWPLGSARAQVERALSQLQDVGEDVVRATETLFGGAMAGMRNRVVWQVHIRLADRLAIVRRVEACLFPDLPNELMGMALAYDAGSSNWRDALASYAERRARRLAHVLEELDPPPGLSNILTI